MKHLFGTLMLTALVTTHAIKARAAELYVGAGLPGVTLGVAHAYNPSFGVRADLTTLGSRKVNGVEEGINYTGTARLQRVGLFGDWFVARGGWRLTGGVTSNKANLDLSALGNGQTLNIGNGNYPTTLADRLDVRINFPSTTPYLGFGYGHQAGAKGFGFALDVGASLGRAKVSIQTLGPNLSLVPQADIDRELAELKNGVAKVRALPQASVALTYRF
jgi:hypothetical protein